MKRFGFWPVFVVMMLAIDVIAAGFLIYAAVADQSFAVEERYYEKSQQWDADAALRARSSQLGWTAEFRIFDGLVDQSASGRLVIVLRDRAGKPISNASVIVEAFLNARASDRQQLTCNEELGGVYTSDIKLSARGQWVFSLRATRGADEFVDTQRLMVGATTPESVP